MKQYPIAIAAPLIPEIAHILVRTCSYSQETVSTAQSRWQENLHPGKKAQLGLPENFSGGLVDLDDPLYPTVRGIITGMSADWLVVTSENCVIVFPPVTFGQGETRVVKLDAAVSKIYHALEDVPESVSREVTGAPFAYASRSTPFYQVQKSFFPVAVANTTFAAAALNTFYTQYLPNKGAPEANRPWSVFCHLSLQTPGALEIVFNNLGDAYTAEKQVLLAAAARGRTINPEFLQKVPRHLISREVRPLVAKAEEVANLRRLLANCFLALNVARTNNPAAVDTVEEKTIERLLGVDYVDRFYDQGVDISFSAEEQQRIQTIFHAESKSAVVTIDDVPLLTRYALHVLNSLRSALRKNRGLAPVARFRNQIPSTPGLARLFSAQLSEDEKLHINRSLASRRIPVSVDAAKVRSAATFQLFAGVSPDRAIDYFLQALKPYHLIFVVDVSGSMGIAINVLRTFQSLCKEVRAVSTIFFGDASVFVYYKQAINTHPVRGDTPGYPALQAARAVALEAIQNGENPIIVLISDLEFNQERASFSIEALGEDVLSRLREGLHSDTKTPQIQTIFIMCGHFHPEHADAIAQRMGLVPLGQAEFHGSPTAQELAVSLLNVIMSLLVTTVAYSVVHPTYAIAVPALPQERGTVRLTAEGIP